MGSNMFELEHMLSVNHKFVVSRYGAVQTELQFIDHIMNTNLYTQNTEQISFSLKKVCHGEIFQQ